jgi:predicted Rossmann fold flavoprotein
MIAAGTAAQNGRSVLLIERNNVLGVKLRITGNGRCNLTNKVGLERFKEFYIDNPKFLYNVFNQFFNDDLIDFFEKLGLKTKIEDNKRVFPVTDKAADVVKALELYLNNNGVEVRCRTLVTGLMIKKDQVRGVKLQDNTELNANRVIIATGGKSYPQLGSNGSGFQWAKKSYHHVIDARPGLCGICVKQNWVKKLQGISLTRANVSVFFNSKKKKQVKGDLVFSHYGISGPLAFDLSSEFGDLIKQGRVELAIDLLDELNQSQALEYLDKIISKSPRNLCKNIHLGPVPQKIFDLCLDLADINKQTGADHLSKKQKRDLINILKQVKLTMLRLRPLNEAMVTRGGVSVKQVDPKTMQSKLVRGLYFCGECLDISGLSGGFNLQAAFSTGYTAGLSAGSGY